MDTLPENSGENVEESMLKCEFIGQIIPTLNTLITDIQTLAPMFENNADLKLAQKHFNSLETLKLADDKMGYINEYRNDLIAGLTKLADFFNGLVDKPLPLTEQQRDTFSQLTVSIITSQASIDRIASY
jgi:hypothetical protein